MEFVNSFKRDSNEIYLFVEGKDDPGYYLPHLRNMTNEHIFVPLVCNGKQRVLGIVPKIKHKIDEEWRALFFVDKDIDDLAGGQRPSDRFVFETPFYSVENFLCNIESIEAVWTQVFRLSSVDARLGRVIDQYKSSEIDFTSQASALMAATVWLRRGGKRPVLANVAMDDIFKFDTDLRVTRSSNWWEVFSRQAEIADVPDWPAIQVIEEELKTHSPQCFIRGKWYLWFMLSFLRRVETVLSERVPTTESDSSFERAKPTVQLNLSNAVGVLSGFSRIPGHLRDWFSDCVLNPSSDHA
jgi:hypothetical protein